MSSPPSPTTLAHIEKCLGCGADITNLPRFSLFELDADGVPVRRRGAVHNHTSHSGKNDGKMPHPRSCFFKAINGRRHTSYWVGTAETVEHAKLQVSSAPAPSTRDQRAGDADRGRSGRWNRHTRTSAAATNP